MRLKTYTAPTISQAMEMIRRDLGGDAIIVSTQGERGRQGARVTAAVEEREGGWQSGPAADRTPPPAIPGEAPPGETPGSASLSAALAYHGLPPPLVDHLAAEAAGYAGEGALLALSAALDGLVAFQPICERKQQRPIFLLGGPGAGKTLTAAKLIVRAHRAGRPVLALSTDTERAGGIEQLEAFVRLLGLATATAADAEAVAQTLASGGDGRLAVIDSAGGNLFDAADRARLAELIAAAAAEPVLVMAAGGDVAEAIDLAHAAVALGCRRLLMTRIDAARRLGALVAIAEATPLALADVGISPQVSDGLVALNPVSLARLLLPETGPFVPTSPMKGARG